MSNGKENDYLKAYLNEVSLYKLRKHAKRRLDESSTDGSSSDEDLAPVLDNIPVGRTACGKDLTEASESSSIWLSSPEGIPANDGDEYGSVSMASEEWSDSISEWSDSSSELSDVSNDENDGQNVPSSEPLYFNSQVNTNEFVFSILKVYFENKMSKKCLSAVLMLINKALPQPNNLPKTKHKLNKFIDEFLGECMPIIHRYCENGSCQAYIGLWHDIDAGNECGVCGSRNISGLFVENSLSYLLKHFLERRGMYRYFQSSSSSDVICDIRDGKLYKELNKARSQYDLTLMWNTDGVPVFKSSNSQLWPLLFTVAELKPIVRNTNVVVAGLWFGRRKPNMTTFLKPFAESLQTLGASGVSWTHPVSKEAVLSKVIAPLCTVDSQARAPLQNISQWNGEYACFRCEQNGEGFPKTYPYKELLPNLRNNLKMRHQATIATHSCRVFGIKGPSCVELIPQLDLARSFVPDYMHCVLLGVVRQFMFLWFDSSNHRKAWYIGGKCKEIDRTLLEILPPSHLSRVPRSIVCRALWKASEFRNWLLFYSLVCVKDFLPKKFFDHWVCLVAAIYTLLKEQISVTELKMALDMLRQFLRGIGPLYGQENYRYNVHLLLHLPEAVMNWGPLWAHSCFTFEKANGQILRLIHGTQEVAKQLVNTSRFVMAYEVLKGYYGDYDDDEIEMTSEYSGSCLLSHAALSPEVKSSMSRFLSDHPGSEVDKIFSKIYAKRLGHITSKMHKKEIKRDSSYVSFNNNGMEKYGQVECFVIYQNIGLFCVVRVLEVENNEFGNEMNYTVRHILKYEIGNSMLQVKPENILQTVINLNNNYIALQPNRFEKNL